MYKNRVSEYLISSMAKTVFHFCLIKCFIYNPKSYFTLVLIIFSQILPKRYNINQKPHNIWIPLFYSTILVIGFNLFIIISSFYIKQNELKQHLNLINESIIYRMEPNQRIGSFLWYCFNMISGVSFNCPNENIDHGRSYVNENISISNCYFSRVSQLSGSGGVIFVTDEGFPRSKSYTLSISYSMFFNCSCSGSGGSIYFYSLKSEIIMICANRCSCNYGYVGLFAYFGVSLNNTVEYLSVSKSVLVDGANCPIYLNYGYQRIQNINSSMNNANGFSGIGVIDPLSFLGTHCTFSNNFASKYSCIGFSFGPGIMLYSIIVHNNSPSAYYGIVNQQNGLYKMYYCIFDMNQGTLFTLEFGSLEVSHCFIFHTGPINSKKPVSSDINNSYSKQITYQLYFFSSHHCNADIPFSKSTFENYPVKYSEETIKRTYDIKCALKNLPKVRSRIKNDMNMLPVLITLMMT